METQGCDLDWDKQMVLGTFIAVPFDKRSFSPLEQVINTAIKLRKRRAATDKTTATRPDS
jgi:hypothetical protein